MELSQLVFTASTTELERASTVIATLVQDMSRVSVASANMARIQAQTEAILARAATESAKARKENARAAEVESRTSIAANKADEARAERIRRSTEATEESTRASGRNVTILQRQSDILEYQAQGWSKGQSSILATAKAANIAADEMEKLQKVLETQRKLMGSDPFDKSMSGLTSLKNQYGELRESIRQYNTDSDLTSKQTKELARDKERLIEKMKTENASFSEIRAAVRSHNEEYVKLAGQYNNLATAEANVIKNRKAVASATDYLTQADQKLAAALNTSNTAIDRSGTDLLVKYEASLRKSGIAQDVATQKLAAYKAQLIQVQGQEEKRRAEHLTRSLAPQATDIAVSLWSGQSPLTVLLQQGGQINDLFMQSGIAAEDFAKTVRASLASMIPAMWTVASGIGETIGGIFMDAAKSSLDFVGSITGISEAVETAQRWITSLGEAQFRWIGIIQRAGAVLTGVFAAGIAVAVAAAVALVVALDDVIKQENELNKAAALSGGVMGLTADIANTYAARLAEVSGNSTKAHEAMMAMAESGEITSDSFLMVGEAAIALNKATGASIEDTVKQFAKMAEAPGKTLTEVAKATGLISAETLNLVLQYERTGDVAKAAEIAQKAYADSTLAAAQTVKSNYGTLTTFAMGVADVFSKMWDTILGVGRKDNLDTRIDELRTRIAENSQAKPGLFLTQDRINQDTKDLNAQFYALTKNRDMQEQIGKQKAKSAEATKYEMWQNESILKTMTDRQKAENELTKLANFRSEGVKQGLWDEAKQLQYTRERQKIEDDLAEKEKKKNKGDSKRENYYAALMREATNATIEADNATNNLTKSELKLLEVRADPRFATLKQQEKLSVEAKYEGAIAAEKQERATIALSKAEEFRAKVLGKSEGLGSQYYAQIKALEDHAKAANWSTEQVDEMIQMIIKGTPVYKAYAKVLDKMTESLRKFSEESIAYNASTNAENNELNFRISLLGKTAEEQRKLQIEYQRELKINAARYDMEKKLRDIAKERKTALAGGVVDKVELQKFADAEVQVQQDTAERIKVINKGVAVEYASDLDKEIRAIQQGISESIVTALFEGGKEGSKKLRSVLVDTLRKKVTIFVDAVVNTLFGGVVNSIFGSSAGQAASGGSNLLGMANNASSLNTIYGAGSQFLYGGSAGASTASLGYANGVGMLGGDSIGALYTANGGWAGVNAYGGATGVSYANPALTSMTNMPTMGASGSAAGGSMGAFAGYAAVVALVANAMGAFRSDKNVGGGLSGTLGGDKELTGYELWREGGTLFDGPNYSTKNPAELIAQYQAQLDAVHASGGDDTSFFPLQERIDALKKEYGAQIEATSKQSKAINDAYDGMRQNVGNMADALGLGSEKVRDWTMAFGTDDVHPDLNGKGVKFDGLDEAGIAAKIQEALASANNELAELILGEWVTTTETISKRISNQGFGDDRLDVSDVVWETVTESLTKTTYVASQYAKENEKAIETLTRLATSLGAVNQVFDTLGQTLYESSLAGGDLASKLVDLFGGMDKFVASTSYYFENYYTEAERQETALRQLTAEFVKHNTTLPETREEYRKLVDAQNLSTEEGQKMYEWLLRMAPAFSEVSIALEQSTTEADNLKQALEDAYTALEKAVKVQIDLLKTQEAAQNDVVKNLKSVFDLLKKNVRELYLQVDSTSAMLLTQARSVISNAVSSGSIPELEVLSEAISTVRGAIEKGEYTTQFEADKARLQFAADLKILQDKTEAQLSTEELILKAIKDSIKYYENLLIESRKQVDALLGISTAVLSVAEALANLKSLMFPESAPDKPLQTSGGSSGGAGGITWGGQSNTSTKYTKPIGGYSGGTIYAGVSKDEEAILDKLANGYHAFDGTGDAAGLNKWIVDNKVTPDQLSGLSGLYATDWEKWYASNDISKFADGGAFTNGVVKRPTMFNNSQMGEAGPEAIMPLTNIGGKLGVSVAGANDSSLADRVGNLEFALQAIAVNTGKMARILDAAQGEDGRSIMTSDAPTT